MSQLANRWAQSCEVHLISWSDIESDLYPLDRRVRRIGLCLQSHSHGTFDGLKANCNRVSRLRKTLSEVQPDLVVSFCDQMNIVCLEASRSLPDLPVWIAEHSDPLQQRLGGLWEMWRKRNYRRCTGAVALTQEIGDAMAQWVYRDRIVVIPPAVTRVQAIQDEYRATAGNGSQVILFVGRLSPEKQLRLLLQAWERIQPDLPGWKLMIVGDGPERQELERTAHSIKEVQFTGWVQSPEQFYRESQIFVLPSRYEGFPVALLEALSFGLPSVTTQCSSAIDRLTSASENQALISVARHSVDDLAKSLQQLARDEPRRRRMSVYARELASLYTWDHIGPLWDRLLIRPQ